MLMLNLSDISTSSLRLKFRLGLHYLIGSFGLQHILGLRLLLFQGAAAGYDHY